MEICLIALHLLLAVLILGVQTLLNGKLHGLHSGPMMSQRLVEKLATVHDHSHLRRGQNAWALCDLVTAHPPFVIMDALLPQERPPPSNYCIRHHNEPRVAAICA